jgi:hypothetical protein
MRLSHIPTRLATGAFILNTGIGKLSADETTAKALHGMAVGTYPFLSKIEPTKFARMLAIGEIGVGSVILAPVIPAWFAGAVLTGFSGSLLRMYLKTPGMTMPDGIRPTQQGTPISKDVWMLGSGLSLLVDGVADRRKKAKRAKRRAKKLQAAHAG